LDQVSCSPGFEQTEAAHEGLLRVEHPTQSKAMLDVIATQQELDARHDTLVKAIDMGLTAVCLLTKDSDLRAQIDAAHAALMPQDTGFTASSYLDEIGNASAAKGRLTAPQKAVLKKIALPEGNMLQAVEEWFAIGAQMDEGERRCQNENNAAMSGPSKVDAVTARNRWIRAVSALESMIALAEVPDDVAQQILRQLWATETKTAHRGARKAELETPASPANPAKPNA
jgi:hypothetical protein